MRLKSDVWSGEISFLGVNRQKRGLADLGERAGREEATGREIRNKSHVNFL